MAYVGVKRLRSGNGEKHRSQDDEAEKSVTEQELHTVNRIESIEDARRIWNVDRPEEPDDGEENRHDRPEEARHKGST